MIIRRGSVGEGWGSRLSLLPSRFRRSGFNLREACFYLIVFIFELKCFKKQPRAVLAVGGATAAPPQSLSGGSVTVRLSVGRFGAEAEQETPSSCLPVRGKPPGSLGPLFVSCSGWWQQPSLKMCANVFGVLKRWGRGGFGWVFEAPAAAGGVCGDMKPVQPGSEGYNAAEVLPCWSGFLQRLSQIKKLIQDSGTVQNRPLSSKCFRTCRSIIRRIIYCSLMTFIIFNPAQSPV